jgi:hypothetical protein
MRRTERLPFAQWADVHRTERFTSVEPVSGYRLVQRENEGYVIYLPPDASDDALGQAFLEVLDRSRFIWPKDEPDFFDRQRYAECDRNWVKNVMHRYRYKTKRDLYKNMNWCRAKRSEGKISIRPHQPIKPECWNFLPPEMYVVIPATTDAEVAGAALRLALDRCE